MTTQDRLDAARFRDQRDQLRNHLDAFARLVDAVERGGAKVMRIEDIRRGLGIGARRTSGGGR